MRRFIVNILLFSCLIAAGLAVCEAYARTCPDSYKVRREMLKTNGRSIETLFIGNSQIYWGVSPADWDNSQNSMNLASNGQTAEMQYQTLFTALPYLPNLKRVFLGYDYCVFFDPPYHTNEGWTELIPYYLYFCVDSLPPGSYNPGLLNRCRLEIANPPAMRDKVIPWRRRPLREDSLGHERTHTYGARGERWMESAHWLAGKHLIDNWDYLAENVGTYIDIIRMCRSNNIEVILLRPPSTGEYFDLMESAQAELSDSIAMRIARRFGLRVMDYRHDSRFSDDDFTDPVHLNTDRGAGHFTRTLFSDWN